MNFSLSEIDENYNSITSRWYRYSENLKRGWVLGCESGKIKSTHLENRWISKVR